MSTRINLLLVVLLFKVHESKEFDDDVCSWCPDRQMNSTVYERCRQDNQTSHDLILNHSCCINGTMSKGGIVGLDLSSCNLKNVTGVLNYLHGLQVLMLENNTELQVIANDFRGLSKLEYLSLPTNVTCPGGNSSWNTTEAKQHSNLCLDEVNLCHTNNVSCPNNNSHCILIAPGEMECLCNDGYYGYKCLRKGMFPYSGYAIALCVCTVVISGVLWCTQRRHVKTVHKD